MAAKSGGYISVEGAVSGTQSARTTEVTSTTPSFTFQTYTTTCNVMVVGGGGASGTWNYGRGGGGGGGGGMILYDSMPVTGHGGAGFPITVTLVIH